jgi:hypothetical protein
MQETLNMSNFLFIVKDLMGQIVGVGHVTNGEDVIFIILNVLSNSYENFVQSVLGQRMVPSFDQLMSKLL